ncbi:MAG: DEAD/DEAH box helicase family protein [Spirochaetaceae bacterium]|nr:DEAD/DEAH box helicase family protein [Spirochaetaceae bacterium]
MNVELFPFQTIAVNELRAKAAEALGSYYRTHTPQVVSLQAPTGAGKTIIMVSLVEDILYGTESFEDQPNAIFIWLSDSPQLNEQSKNKFLKSDKISVNRCITVQENNFDQEVFDDGKIYFINTQKITKTAKLCKHSDSRQYTIWETVENTAKQKSDRLYFIIDEAHRGMQDKNESGKATSIMQRFLKGAPDLGLTNPVPLVIGVSATAARFNNLIGDINSTLQKVIVKPSDVRSSGLLKERIVITYPDDTQKNNDMAVLDAATDEWISKVQHWTQYCKEQHYKYINPIFVVQVKAGRGDSISDSNLDDIIAKIEDRIKVRFKEHDVVHTFGDVSTITLNGLKVHHIEPNDIVDDMRIKVVLFKENLSTGWDCPRAETMMSFRRAEDVTYIAQLLGRMVRTPMQSHIRVDDSLNDVRLFLPYFNRENVESVVKEIQESECGDIPTVVDTESIEQPIYKTWTVRTSHPRVNDDSTSQPSLFEDYNPNIGFEDNKIQTSSSENLSIYPAQVETVVTKTTDIRILDIPSENNQILNQKSQKEDVLSPELFVSNIDKEEVTKFINDEAFLTYVVRSVKITSYLKSLTSLVTLLTHSDIDRSAIGTVTKDVVEMIYVFAEKLRVNGEYEKKAKEILTYKLSIKIFDVFGKDLSEGQIKDSFYMSNTELDRQLRAVDAQLAGFGFPQAYGQKYYDPDNPDEFKIDCILFALDDECMIALNKYAEKKFHEYNDANRRYIVQKSENIQKQYRNIISDGDIVSKHNFTLPEEIIVPEDPTGKEYTNHLFADEKTGKAKIKLNSWEDGVIEEEQERPDFVCWIRNPSRASWSLTIPYEINNEIKPSYPDFIIVRKDYKSQAGYVIDILEPHNPEYKDNLPKAKGFARYAEAEPKIGRIQLIRKVKDGCKDRFKRLDFSKGEIRQKVLMMQTSDELDHLFDTDGFFE